jgi:hypothetical protein
VTSLKQLLSQEILQHGLSLLHEDSDRNRRLALLSIDNAVGLTIKTYLGLPKRVTGIQISRRDFAVWVDFEKLIASLSEKNIDRMSTLCGRPRPPMIAVRELLSLNGFSPQDAEKIEELRKLRNEVVHGAVDFRRAISRQTVKELRSIVNKYGDSGQAE